MNMLNKKYLGKNKFVDNIKYSYFSMKMKYFFKNTIC